MPLIFLFGAFVTGAFVAHGAHAALRRQEELHDDLKDHIEKHVDKVVRLHQGK